MNKERQKLYMDFFNELDCIARQNGIYYAELYEYGMDKPIDVYVEIYESMDFNTYRNDPVHIFKTSLIKPPLDPAIEKLEGKKDPFGNDLLTVVMGYEMQDDPRDFIKYRYKLSFNDFEFKSDLILKNEFLEIIMITLHPDIIVAKDMFGTEHLDSKYLIGNNFCKDSVKDTPKCFLPLNGACDDMLNDMKQQLKSKGYDFNYQIEKATGLENKTFFGAFNIKKE